MAGQLAGIPGGGQFLFESIKKPGQFRAENCQNRVCGSTSTALKL
jgi:hypothetical protein